MAGFFLHLVVWLLGRELGSILWWVRLGPLTTERDQFWTHRTRGTFMGFLRISALGGPGPLVLLTDPCASNYSFFFLLLIPERKGG